MHLYDGGGCVYGARCNFRYDIHSNQNITLQLNEFRSCMSQNALPSQLVTNQGILLKI